MTIGVRDRLVRPHLPGRTVRLRLTALYGALFLAGGFVLLTITYVLVSRATDGCFTTQDPSGATVTLCGSGDATSGEGRMQRSETRTVTGGTADPQDLTPQQAKMQASVLEAQAMSQRDAQLHQLLVQSGIALGAMAIISIGLGWIIAGRVLQPLRTITSTARRISATNLHERLALTGPNDELKNLGDTFDDLLERLERSFEAQRRFVANASHELRTPLARQRAVVQVALTDPDATAESLRVAHEHVLAAGAEQERLIESLLTLARGQGGLRTSKVFDLADVANRVLRGKLAEAEHQGVEIRSSFSTAASSGDPRLIERLIENLLENALRYNEPDGYVDILIETHEERAVISVSNTGPVVPESDVDRLLQPFQRHGPDRIHQGHGVGLGLSIVKAIAEAHGARLKISPRTGGGLVVEVRFP